MWPDRVLNISSAAALGVWKLQSQVCLGSKWLPRRQVAVQAGADIIFGWTPVQYLITQSNLSTVWMLSISVRVIKRSRTLGKHKNEDTAARWWDCFNSQSVSYSFDPQLKGSQPHKADKLKSRRGGQAQDDSICFKPTHQKKKEGKKKHLTAVTTGQKKVETNNKIHDAIKQIHSWGVGLRSHKLNHSRAA